MIFEVSKEIFKMINAYDKIPSDFDFSENEYGIEIKIAESISGDHYKNDITLQVRIVGIEANKIAMLKKSEELDKILNKHKFLNCRILRENVWNTSYYDEDKFNIVLQYIIRKI